MRFFDFFGIHKSLPEPEPSPEDAAVPSQDEPDKGKARPWRPLLAADIVLIMGCLGLLGGRVYRHLGSVEAPQPAAQAPSKVPPKAQAQPEKKEPAPATAPAAAKPKEAPPAPAKAEPPKAEAKASKPEPKPAKPEPKPVKPEAKAAKPAEAKPAKAEPKPESKPAAGAPAAAAASEPKKAMPTKFSYSNPAATHVTLLGSFLVRTGGKKAMFKGSSKGEWECTLYLNPGASYRYRYEVVEKHGRRTLTGWETIEVH